MSFSTENEIRNVICDWKIKNLGFGVETYNGTIQFFWPMSKNMLCFSTNLQYEAGRNTFFRLRKKTDASVKLSGTISIVTVEKTVHVLGQFDSLFKDEWENVPLKDFTEFKESKDILFPNNKLTLRIHLWKPSVENDITVKQYAYTKPFEEKCFFQWIVKSETDDSQNECFTKYVMEVPRTFTDFVKRETFQISMTLEFLKADYGIAMTFELSSLSTHSFVKFKIDAISETESETKCLLDTELLYFDRQTYRFQNNYALQDLKSKKSMYYPKGYLQLHCDVYLVSCPLTVIEDICFTSDYSRPKHDNKQNASEDTLKDCMYTLYSKGQFCDVTLCTEEEKFPCHKAVLCARSSVFRAMFENDMREKENGVVSIKDVDTRALGFFLTALYTDTLVDLDWDCALKVYATADKYDVSIIQKKCIAFLLQNLSTSNVCGVLEVSDTHQDEDLKAQVQEFVFKHLKEIIKSVKWAELMSRNPFLTAQVMQQAFSELL